MVRSNPRTRRWFIWTSLAAAFLIVNLHRLSTAVLAEPLARAFDATAAELGTLHSAFFYVYAPLQVVAGVLSDRFGIRRTAAAGAAVMSLGALAFGAAGTYAVAFLGRFVIGLGASVIYIATLRFCANWFRPDEFATMNGLTLALSGVGGLLATTPLALVVASLGWAATLRALGVAGLVVAVVVYAIARDTPESAGLEPIENVPAAPTLTLSQVVANAGRILRDGTTWIAGLILFTSIGVQLTVLGLWGIPYLVQTYGVTVTSASTYTLYGTIGIILGTPVIGWLSDRFRWRTGLVVVAVLVQAAAFGVIAALGRPPLPLIGAVFFLTGFIGGGVAITYTVIKNRHDSAASGVATGTINALGFAGAAVFPPAMGLILDSFWTGETIAGARVYTEFGYRVAFGLAAAAGLVAFVGTLALYARTAGDVPFHERGSDA